MYICRSYICMYVCIYKVKQTDSNTCLFFFISNENGEPIIL